MDIPAVISKLKLKLAYQFETSLRFFLSRYDNSGCQLLLNNFWVDKSSVAKNGAKIRAGYPFIQVLSRSCYSERERLYPLPKGEDLKKVLNAEFAGQVVFHQFLSQGNASTLVMTYQVQPHCLVWLKSGLVLPESLLLAKAVSAKPCLLQIDTTPLYFIHSTNASINSVIQNALCSSMSDYAVLQGLSSVIEQQKIEKKDLADYTLKGLKAMNFADLRTFFYWPKVEISPSQMKQWGLVFCAAAFLFLGSIHLFTEWQIVQRSRDIAELGPKVDELLQAKKKHEDLLARVQVLHSIKPEALFPLWQLIADLEAFSNKNKNDEVGIKLSDIKYNGKVWSFTGNARRSTDVLSFLAASKQVNGAVFSEPVRNISGRELFSIQFELVTPNSSNGATP